MKNSTINKNKLQYFLFFVLLISFIPHSFAAVEPVNGFMDKIYAQITTKNALYTSVFQPVALSLLTGLSVIELAFDTGTRLIKESNGSKLIAYIVVRICMLLIIANLIQNLDWITSATDFAYKLGGDAGGVAKSVTPSSVASMGVTLFNAIMVKIKMDISGLSILTDPQLILYGLIIIVVGLGVIILFTLIGLLFLVTKVESTLVISIGIMMLGFLGSSWTNQWGKSYFSYILAVCIKLIVMLVVIGLVQDVTYSWSSQIADAGKDFDKLLDTIIYIVTCSIILLWIVMNIPSMAAGIVSGVSTAGLSSLMAAGTAGAAAGAALVAGGASFMNGAKNSIKGQTGSIEGMPGGGGGDSGSGNESQMGPSGGDQSPTPPSGGDGSGGGISGNNSGGSNNNSSTGEKQKPDTTRREAAMDKFSSANRNMQSAEGQTSVSPPSMNSKHLDI